MHFQRQGKHQWKRTPVNRSWVDPNSLADENRTNANPRKLMLYCLGKTSQLLVENRLIFMAKSLNLSSL